MRLCSIASGSSGNCIYVGSDCAHVLVDVGISKKRIEEGLRSIDMDVRDMDGILITHEHSDHMKGLGVHRPAHRGDAGIDSGDGLRRENAGRAFS